ncbi:hypothetical protein AWH69_03720 [Janibacter melonis]|uniref:PknH-like extracellular domain-containing protein n=1 Tax=Janibacter melonis TaxID=262209 RepID=A0A176QGG0_9MICO|nr:hypothetical protein [Janibacter melonis]OAB88886.1 hypothetical protein AWH69_03720 [Janibacter melonis]
MTRRPARVAAACALGLLLLPGCTALPFGDDEEEAPVPTTSAPRQVESYVLDDEQAARTIPEPLPGWDRSPVDDTPTRWRKTDPPACIDVLLLGQPRRDAKAMQSGRASDGATTGSGDSLRVLNVTVESHERPVAPALLDRAQQALPGCSAFAFYGEQGGSQLDERISAEALPTQAVGQQSVGIRKTLLAKVGGEQKTYYLDTLAVRDGNTLVVVTLTHTDPQTDLSPLGTTAQKVIAAVPEAAR